GDDAQAHEWVGMTDVSRRQPARQQRSHATPGQMIALTASTQHTPPKLTDRLTKGTDRRAVHRHAVVTNMSENDRTQIGTHRRDGIVQASPEFGFHLSQLRL